MPGVSFLSISVVGEYANKQTDIHFFSANSWIVQQIKHPLRKLQFREVQQPVQQCTAKCPYPDTFVI